MSVVSNSAILTHDVVFNGVTAQVGQGRVGKGSADAV